MNNYDPWHMLENVSEKELQEFCNKQASKSGQHHQRPLREGFVFLISYFEAIEHIPRRLQFRALKVLLDYAFTENCHPRIRRRASCNPLSDGNDCLTPTQKNTTGGRKTALPANLSLVMNKNPSHKTTKARYATSRKQARSEHKLKNNKL